MKSAIELIAQEIRWATLESRLALAGIPGEMGNHTPPGADTIYWWGVNKPDGSQIGISESSLITPLWRLIYFGISSPISWYFTYKETKEMVETARKLWAGEEV